MNGGRGVGGVGEKNYERFGSRYRCAQSKKEGAQPIQPSNGLTLSIKGAQSNAQLTFAADLEGTLGVPSPREPPPLRTAFSPTLERRATPRRPHKQKKQVYQQPCCCCCHSPMRKAFCNSCAARLLLCDSPWQPLHATAIRVPLLATLLLKRTSGLLLN